MNKFAKSKHFKGSTYLDQYLKITWDSECNLYTINSSVLTDRLTLNEDCCSDDSNVSLGPIRCIVTGRFQMNFSTNWMTSTACRQHTEQHIRALCGCWNSRERCSRMTRDASYSFCSKSGERWALWSLSQRASTLGTDLNLKAFYVDECTLLPPSNFENESSQKNWDNSKKLSLRVGY